MENKKQEMNLDEMEKVFGGFIYFNADRTKCGIRGQSEYIVHNYNAVFEFIRDNSRTMTEEDMLFKLWKSGYLTRIN